MVLRDFIKYESVDRIKLCLSARRGPTTAWLYEPEASTEYTLSVVKTPDYVLGPAKG